MRQDPIARLRERLDQEASALRRHLEAVPAPRERRAAVRALLSRVYRMSLQAPSPEHAGRRDWAREAREALRSMEAASLDLTRRERRPLAFYTGDRLGVIRRVEPVRIRFALGRLGRPERFERFELLAGARRRAEWLWARVTAHAPAAAGDEVERSLRLETGREGAEFIWGRVRR